MKPPLRLLGELITPAATHRAGQTQVPILSMTMHGGLVDQEQKFKKRVASVDTSEYKLVGRGQLVVGFPIDEGVLDFQSAYDQAIVSPAYGIWDLKCEEGLDREYLARFLRSSSALRYYKSKLRGTAARRRSLPVQVFLDLLVPVPTQTEQRRITGILKRSEALRAQRRRSIELHDDLRRSMLESALLERQYRPAGWLDKPLSTLVSSGDSINYGVVQPGGEVQDGVPLIRAGDLREEGPLRTNELKRISPVIEASYRRSRIVGNEILVSCVGSIGQVTLATPTVIGANVARAVARVPIDSAQLRVFVADQLRSSRVQRYFTRELRTVAQPTLNIKQLSETVVVVPPAQVLEKYHRQSRTLTRQRDNMVRQEAELISLHAALESLAFRGEL